MTRASRALVSSICLALPGLSSVSAPILAQSRGDGLGARWWAGATVVLVSASLLDRSTHDFAVAHRSAQLDRVADAVDPLGRARYLIPAMAGTYVVSRAIGERRWSAAVFRIAAGYVAADAIESVLKPAVGRHRPDSTTSPWTFQPFSTGSDWHSFPSAHAVHAFAIAAGIAEEARRPWVSVTAYGVATLVGLQRVYGDAHWASDVAASAVLAVAVSKTTNHWLRDELADDWSGPRIRFLVSSTGPGFAGSLRW